MNENIISWMNRYCSGNIRITYIKNIKELRFCFIVRKYGKMINRVELLNFIIEINETDIKNIYAKSLNKAPIYFIKNFFNFVIKSGISFKITNNKVYAIDENKNIFVIIPNKEHMEKFKNNVLLEINNIETQKYSVTFKGNKSIKPPIFNRITKIDGIYNNLFQ